jgi:putative glycosyl hydrolase-like family 15 (GHL15) protein/type IX secretion system substrate protein
MKKKLFFSLMIACAISFNIAVAQIQSFPPEGYENSNFEINLPNGHFLPSTERWNLVWADQLVPGWITPGKVEFAAKNYIGTQKIWSNQVDEFREYDPNFICVIYHLALGLNPEKNSDCPDPKDNSGEDFIGVVAPDGYVSEWNNYFLPWLENNQIDVSSDLFEDMFQHYDAFDFDHRVWHRDPYWLMDASNSNWRKFLIETCQNWMLGNENEGCFFDVAVETNSYLYNPNIHNPEPTQFEWWLEPHKPYNSAEAINDRHDFANWMNEMYLEYFQEIYKEFHSGDEQYLVIPNVDQMVTTVYNPTWMDGNENGETIDGAMIESFGGYTGYDMYLTLSRCVEHITGRGKILIAQFYDPSPEERYRRTGMYMLIKNNVSYINILGSGVEWYPEYEIDLGNQDDCPTSLEELRVSGEGWESLWRRDFEYGIVLCNTSNSAISYDLNEHLAWFIAKTSGGGEVSNKGEIQEQSISKEIVEGEITIPASKCILLEKQLKGAVGDYSEKISVYPNPCTDRVNIEFEEKMPRIINLYDVLGNKMFSNEIFDKSVQIPTSELSSGVYYLELINGSSKIQKILIKK